MYIYSSTLLNFEVLLFYLNIYALRQILYFYLHYNYLFGIIHFSYYLLCITSYFGLTVHVYKSTDQ